MKDNAKIIERGLQKAYNQIVNKLFIDMYDICERLLLEVPKHREFLGFTGNTQTSYACGLYVDGKLEEIVQQRNWNASPVRRKIKLGQKVWLREPYEGKRRSVWGKVPISRNHGRETSMWFLENYRAPRNRICIVMTTGTEYSEYIEEVRHLDVLTGTYEAAKGILAKGFKPIPSQ